MKKMLKKTGAVLAVILIAAMMFTGGSYYTKLYAVDDNIKTRLDDCKYVNGGIMVRGWCFDQNDKETTLEIEVYIGGSPGDENAEVHTGIPANSFRSDVDAAFGCGENHGFVKSIATQIRGDAVPVTVYAVNPETGDNNLVGSKTVDTGITYDITSALDEAEPSEGALCVKGWAFDEVDYSAALTIEVYIGGDDQSKNAEKHTVVADLERTDVNAVYACGNNHGFDTTVKTKKTGSQDVYVYAIAANGTDKEPVGSKNVSFPADPQVTVTPSAGDVNRDGRVNNKDVVALFRYVNGSLDESSVDIIACDTNGNDKIDNKDVVLLFRHILNPKVEIYYIIKVKTFYNPISTKGVADPFITYHDGYYYGLGTEVYAIRLYRSKTVENLFSSTECKTLISTGDSIGSGKTLGGSVWAPELHYVPTTGKWYIYSCACSDGDDFSTMRMFCLESEGSDPFGNYTFKGFTLTSNICIDQTVYYDEASGKLYTAYCRFDNGYWGKGQVLMIAEMSSPWKVGKTRVTISYPEYDWEKMGTNDDNDGRVNEGPFFLKRDGRLFLVYSASGCWSRYYCLGMLEYVGADTQPDNFLNAKNWKKCSEPVFKEGNNVYGVGHCSFFNSPDGSEVWMSYHGMSNPDAGVGGRYPYIQKIDFEDDGTPIFGEPISRSTELFVPSGQK